MSVISLMHPLANLPGYLVEPALRALAVAGITALVMAIVPVRRAGLRLYVWTAVLYAALAMPLLGAFLPRLNVAFPGAGLIPSTWHAASPEVSTPQSQPPAAAPEPSSVVSTASSLSPRPEKPHRDRQRQSITAGVPQGKTVSSSAAYAGSSAAVPPSMLRTILRRIQWKIIVAAIYLLGLSFLLARLILGLWWARRLAHSAQDISVKYFLRKDEIEDERSSTASALLTSRSSLAGLKHPPRLKESALLSVPATVGLRHPVILLPVGWRTWTDDELQAVLAHEISHVARRDALTQLLSLLHRAAFWFSPLPWWLDRQLMELAEQASDEAALAGGADRMLYAETLLGFFARLQSAPGRVRWQALSMANRESAGRAERRVDRILAWKGAAITRKSFVIALIALAAPVIFLAASLGPFIVYAKDQPSLPVRLQSGSVAGSVPTATAPATVTSENAASVLQQDSATTQKSAEHDEQQSSENTNTMNINGGSYTSGPRYVYVRGNSNNVTMSGNDEDLSHARALHKKINGDFIWFERDEKSYVITDPAFMQKVNALFAPEDELAKKQDELGRQQDELGRQQDALGEQMDKATVKVPDITPDLERIRARLKELEASGATQSELGRVQSQIGELQGQIGRLQSQIGTQQSGIGRQQGELGRKQGELGRLQGELGRQQGEIARHAARELRRMFDDAIATGIAKPE